MKLDPVSAAPVSTVRIADIQIGTRRRVSLGRLDRLQRSIAARGLINPIVLRNGHDLVAGQRRLEACKRLGWTSIPARHVERMSDEELRAIELEENSERLALNDYDASAARLAEIRQAEADLKAKAEAEFRSNVDRNSKRGRKNEGRPPKAGSRRDVAEATGASATEQHRVERHVMLADQFPFLKRPGWQMHSVLTAGHHLEQLPEAERSKLAALLDQDNIPPRKAIDIIANVASLPAQDRRVIWQQATSSDSHIRAQALAKAAALPPEPDPGLTRLNTASGELKRAATSCRDHAFKPRIGALQTAAEELYEAFLAKHREQGGRT